MKLYLAKVTNSTLMDGSYEQVLGVYSTPEKAVEALKTHWNFDEAENLSKYLWRYIFDGELSMYYEVADIELDKLPE